MWHTKRLYGGFCPPSFKEFLGLFPRPPPPSFFKMESRFTSSFLLHHPIFNGLEKIPQSSGQNWVKLGKYIYIVVAAWGYFFLLSPFLYGIYLFEQDGKKLTQFTFFPIDFHCRIQDTDHRGEKPRRTLSSASGWSIEFKSCTILMVSCKSGDFFAD